MADKPAFNGKEKTITLPASNDYIGIKNLIKKYQLPKCTMSQFGRVLEKMGLPDEGGQIKSERLSFLRAVMRTT